MKIEKVTRSILSLFLLALSNQLQAVELNIATVSNAHMIEMQKLTPEFEKQFPDIKLKWHVYGEGSLRMRVIADIASEGGNYDVVTIGLYETPIWAKRQWLLPIIPTEQYDVQDIIPPIRSGLSYQGNLYAAPFYGESSMLMYRKDLTDKAGISFQSRPTWQDIKLAAEKLHDPSNDVYGICLRGRPGWGDNMALVSTMVNSYGGRWFDMNWQPQINSQAWQDAVSFYIELLNSYGPPDPEKNSFGEILAMSRAGKCAMWVDASIAASFISDKGKSKFASSWAYTEAPYQTTTQGASWLWAWALAIPKQSTNIEAAQSFINWATSKQYIELVASKNGWSNVPTGTRISTYQNSAFTSAVGSFAEAELTAIYNADPNDNTLLPSPYSGIQFAAIPEFIAIGGVTGQKIANALQGKITVKQALDNSQKMAEREMKRAGYYKNR